MVDDEDIYAELTVLSARKVYPNIIPYLDYLPRCHELSLQIAKSVNVNSSYELTCVHLMTKAIKSLGAIATLLECCFVQDAWILLRALFEVLINLKYISKEDSEDRSLRYREYSHVVIWRMYEANRMVNAKYKFNHKASPQRLMEMKTDYDRVKSSYRGKYKGWAQISIRQMAKKTGLRDQYDMLYDYSSQFSHSTALTEKDFLKEGGDKTEIVAFLDPQPNEEKHYIAIIVNTCWIMMEIDNIINKVIRTDMSDRINNLYDEFARLVNENRDKKIGEDLGQI